MKIEFSKKIEKSLTSSKQIKKEYGACAKVIEKTLETIRKTNSYKDLWNIPGHWHGLEGQVKDVYCITILHPFRMVFRWIKETKTLLLIAIEDYHEKKNRVAAYNYNLY